MNLHVISLNIPYPADYGGVIDIFYKLKSLSEANVDIYLHAFEYNRPRAEELNKFCKKIFYYKRKKGLKYFFQAKPYIVATRNSSRLLNNLLSIEGPILFEGLHTTYILPDKQLKNRVKIVRAHNIEHEYYHYLAKSTNNIFKKIYFVSESRKLKKFGKILEHADLVAAISKNDHAYFNSRYNTILLPAYHQFSGIESKPGLGNYALYHGDLSTPENIAVVKYLVKQVFAKINYPLQIAGKNPSREIVDIARAHDVMLHPNPTDKVIKELIQEAQFNLLVTFQPTGLKLKLLSSAFLGRFIIANSNMIMNTGVENECIICNSTGEIIHSIEKYKSQEFTANMIEKRAKTLQKNFDKKSLTDQFLDKIKSP
jgi:hypothetical protein